MKPFLFIALFLLSQVATVAAIDRKHVQNQYQNGELQLLSKELSGWLKGGRKFSRADSIFIYKYLSVALAADTSSRILAQDYMYKLLVIEPGVDIIDLYVSPGIYSMFQSAKKEIEQRQKYFQNQASIENKRQTTQPEIQADKPLPFDRGTSQRPPSPTIDRTESSHAHWIYWTLGGAAIAGAVTTYLVLAQEPGGNKTNIVTNGPQ